MHAGITRLGQNLDSKYDSGKFHSHYIGIQVGDAKPKTKLHVKGAFGGAEEKALFEETLGKLGRDWEEQIIVLTLGTSNPVAAKAGLKVLVDSLLQIPILKKLLPYDLRDSVIQLLPNINFEYLTTEDTVSLVISSEDPVIQSVVLGGISALLAIVKKDTAGSVHADIGLKNDFTSILKNEKEGVRKSLFEELLEGLSVEVKAKISPRILAFFRSKIFEEEIKYSSHPGSKMEIAGFFINGSKVSIKLNEFKELVPMLSEALKDSPLRREFPVDKIPALGDLIRLAKAKKFDKGVREEVFFAVPIIEFFREHIKASVTLTFRVKKTIATAHFETSGIKEVVDSLFGK